MAIKEYLADHDQRCQPTENICRCQGINSGYVEPADPALSRPQWAVFFRVITTLDSDLPKHIIRLPRPNVDGVTVPTYTFPTKKKG